MSSDNEKEIVMIVGRIIDESYSNCWIYIFCTNDFLQHIDDEHYITNLMYEFSCIDDGIFVSDL